jgi:phasin family protein
MAKNATSAVEATDFFKMPDFTQYQADFGKWMGDFSKTFANGKTPVVDFDAVVALQRKNIEALTSANQVAFEGVKAFAQRQAEIAREAVEEFSKVAKEFTSAGSPEEKLAKQAEVAKAGFEHALSNVRELTDMVQKANVQAIDVISKRVAANFDDVKAAITKSAKK